METKVNKISDKEREVEVTLDYDEIKDDINKAYQKERKNISMDGFRKGKVPMGMIKKMYGEAIEYKASEDIASNKFWDAVKQENLEPVGQPSLTDLDFQPGEKLNFKVKFEVIPEIEVDNYKDLEVEKPVFKVTDEMVEKEVDQMLKSKSQLEEAEVVEGTNFKVTADLQRVDDSGAPIVGTRSEDVAIDLSDDRINPQIVQNLEGKKVGDTFNFQFETQPQGEEGKTEEFKYQGEVKKIEKFVYPEVTEELAKELSGNKATTLDELKEHIKNDIENYYTQQSERIYMDSLLKKVVENNDFEPPQGLVDATLKQIVEQEKQNAQQQGQPNFDEEEAKERLKENAVWNSKWQVVSENIAEKEEIKVEEEDYKELAERDAQQMGISADKLIEYYKSTGIEKSLLEKKVVDFLKEANPPKEVDADKKVQEEKEKEENK